MASFKDYKAKLDKKYREDKVTEEEVNSWLKQAQETSTNFKPGDTSKYTTNYGSESSSAVNSLLDKSDDVWRYLYNHKDEFKDADKLRSQFGALRSGLTGINSHIDDVNDYYGQWENEEHYRVSNMSADDIAPYLNDKDNPVAYTTKDGQNLTWRDLYDSRKAEEDMDTRYKEYSARADWAKMSKGIDNIEDTKSDYMIVGELQQTLMPHDKQTALASGFTVEEFNDIDSKRKYIGNKYGVDLYADIYNNVNILNDIMSQLDGNEAEKDTFDYMSYMSDDEKAVFNYIYNTEGRDAALEWHNGRKGLLQDRFKDYHETNLMRVGEDDPVMMSALSVAFSLASGLEYAGDVIDYAVTGEEQYNKLAGATSSIRGGASNTIDSDFGKFLYNTGMSGIDSLAASYIPGGTFLLAGSAAGQGYNNAIARGLSGMDALTTGFREGINEYLFERLSLGRFDKLKDSIVKGGRAFAGNLAKTMFVNATEEMLTDVANVVSDRIVNADLSQVATSYRQYLANGLSPEEAKEKTKEDINAQIFESGASGALMGFGFGTIGNAYGAYNYNQAAKAEGARVMSNYGVDDLKALANEVAGATQNKSLTKMANKASSNMSKRNAVNVGRLSFEVDSARMEQNRADLTKALIDKGVSEAKAKNYADILVEMNEQFYRGEKSSFELGTNKQWKKITGDENAYSILRNIVTDENSTVNIRNLNHNLARMGLKQTEDGKITLSDHNEQKVREFEEKVLKKNYDKQSESIKATVAEDGKTKVVSTDTEVTVNGIDHIEVKKDKDGKIEERIGYVKVADADGNESVVPVTDVKFGSRNDAVLYETFVAMDIDTGYFDAFVKNFNEADFDASIGEAALQYATGFRNAFRYGWANMETEMNEDMFASKLTDTVRNTAYTLGKESIESKIDTEQEALDTAVAERKDSGKGKVRTQGELHMADTIKTKPKKSFTKAQNAGIGLAKRLTSIGYDVYLYESHKDEDGNWVDENGNEADNGFYRAADGSIHIDINAGRGDVSLMAYTLAHELVHSMRRYSPREFKVLADLLYKWYGKKGHSINQLVESKMDELDCDWDTAYEEVIADSCESFLTDSDIADRILELKNTDNKTWETIRDKVLKFLKWMKSLFVDVDPDSVEGRFVRQYKDEIDHLYDAFYNALASASETMQWIGAGEVTTDAVAVEETTKHSYRSLAQAAGFEAREVDGVRGYYRNGQKVSKVTVEDIEISPIGAMINYSLDKGDISKEDADKQKKMFADICTLACKTNDFSMTMQFVGSAVFTGMKANADKQYGTTYDFPSICTKTQAVIDAMSKKMVTLKRGLSSEEILDLYQEVFASGNPVPCPECYVFSRWIGIGGLLDNIYEYQTHYGKMSVADASKAYAELHKKVAKYASENSISFGKAKGALAKTITDKWAKLTEKIEKADNQGEKVKDSDRALLKSLENEMVTVKALSWLDKVYFVENPLDSNGNPKANPKVNKNYAVPVEVLFDLNKGDEFASKYSEAWGFRTTQGAGYGKAITPYAEAVLGEGILATNNTTNTIKTKAKEKMNNPFLEQRGMMDKNAKKALDRARLKQKIQAFLGGQRFQSTSDARYENASDYLLAALEMQAMHGRVQVYTKVDGAVPAFSAWGFSINQSLMPLGGGLDAKGNVIDTKVGGMNPKVAFKNRENHETAGTITIGVNDNHIRKMFADIMRDFIIPYHASGGKAWLVNAFRMAQDKAAKKDTFVRSTDYSRTQGDKVLSDTVLMWQGKTDAEIEQIHAVREARLAILTGGKPNMDVVRGNRFLSALYDKFHGGEWDGVKIAKSKVESQIFPNEFWDESVTYEESGKITQDYLDYCDDLGFLHRFSGMVPQNGILVPVNGYNERGERVQLTDLAYKYKDGVKTSEIEPFFWKVLTDRRMYDNSGNYLAQKVVTLNDTTTDTVTNFAKKNDGRQYDKLLSMETANKIANGERISGDISLADVEVKHSLRKKAPPKKTAEVYKLMRLKDGKIYPLFIDSTESLDIGTWYDADSPNLDFLKQMPSGIFLVDTDNGSYTAFEEYLSKSGEKQTKFPSKKAIEQAAADGTRWVYIEDVGRGQKRFGGETRKYWNLGINGSGAVSTFSMRPGYHAGSLPSMRQIGKGANKDLRDDTFVWTIGEVPADIDYQAEADRNPDKDIPTHIPVDGYYLKATNADKAKSQADVIGWYVAGAYKINRIISDSEARQIIDDWNAEHPNSQAQYDYDRESGMDFDAESMTLVPREDGIKKSSRRDSNGRELTENQQEFFKDSKVRDAEGNLLVVYHGTDADFTVFEADKDINGELYYFAKSRTWVKNFFKEEKYHAPKNIMRVYLNIKNPLDLRSVPYTMTGNEWIDYFDSIGVPITDEFRSIYSAPQKNRKTFGTGNIPAWWLIRYDSVGGKLRDSLYSVGYDGLIIYDTVRGKADATAYVCFEKNQVKRTTNLNPTKDPDIRYQRRGTGMSNRSILANALESATQHESEAKRLEEYKKKIDLINAEEQKLREARERIKELSFAKGPKDTVTLKNLHATATRIANRINTYDKQLLNLEATAPLKAVLEREKAMVRKREKQKAAEALAKYREKSTETLREVMNRNAESRKRGIENRRKAEVRHKIKDYKSKLEKTLLNPTDRRYVPIDLISAMVDVCDLIDTDTPLYKADGELNKAQQKRELTKERLQALKDEYENLKSNSDPMYAGEFDDMVYAYLTDLRNNFGGKNLNDMSLDELTEMYETLRAIGETLQDARKLIGWADAESVYEAGDAIVAEQNKITAKRKKGKRSKAQKAKDWVIDRSLSPVRNVERMSGYAEGSFLKKLFNEFERGIRKKNKFVMDSYKGFEELTSGKEYDDAVYSEFGKEYEDVNGRKFRVSKMQMMQAILSHDREVANHMNHIQSGGFTFADLDMLRKGKLKDAISEENSHRVPSAVEMVGEFREALKDDKWCQDYMKAAREFFDGKAKDAVNETSISLKHRIIARDKNYIPFEVDKNFVVREISAMDGVQQTINSYGMLKETTDGAPQALIITGLNNILDRHIEQVGTVYGLAIPVRNFNKVWNVRSLDAIGNDPTVRAAIQRNWGDEGVAHIEQAVRDLQGSRPDTQSALYKFIKSGYITSTFTLNLSVVAKQIGSLFSATSMLRWRDPAKMIGNLLYTMANHKKISAEVDKYTATAWMRRQGMSDAELYTLSTMAKKPGLLRLMSKAPALVNPVKWITAMDHAVALSLWRYAKQDIKNATGLDGEALLEATAEFYDEVVENTQSMTDVLHRPEIQKRSDVISESFGMFKTDLYQMAGQLQTAVGRYKANKSKENGKALARTAYSVLMSSVWGQLMTTVFALLLYKVNPYRDDEDEELTVESWLKRQSFGLIGDLTGYLIPLFGSEAIGIVENIMYGESDDVVDNIVLDAINTMYDAMITVASSVKDGEMPKPEQTKKLLVKALQLFKVPSNNILRIIDAIKLHAEDIANGEFLSFEAGAERTANHEIHRIIEAVEGDDRSSAVTLFNDIVNDRMEDGKELDEVMSSLKTALGNKFKDGKVDEATARYIMSNMLEMSSEDIYWQFDKWGYAKDNGSSEDYDKYDGFISAVKSGTNVGSVIRQYTDNGVEMDSLKTALGNAYKDGTVGKSSIENALTTNFDMDEDDVYWQFDRWDYAKKNGSSEGYSKYGDFFTAVESGRNLKDTIKLYTDHGVETKTLASQITQHFKPLYKEMSNAERANIKGYLLNAYVQLGYKRTDKNKDINDWLKD